MPEAAHLSRSRLARLIAEGAVRRGAAVMSDPKARVAEGDLLVVAVPAAAEVATAPEAIPLDIRYEDDDLLVLMKPAGLVMHPAPGSPGGTVVNALLHHFGGALSGVGGEKRPGIVHRIDKDTSGLVVIAKTDRAHHGLADQFAAHSVRRRYAALCHGVPSTADPRLRGLRGVSVEPGEVIRLETGLARHRTDRQRQAVTFTGGRQAVTRITADETFCGVAALDLVPPRDGADASNPRAHGVCGPRFVRGSCLWWTTQSVGAASGGSCSQGGRGVPAPGVARRRVGVRPSGDRRGDGVRGRAARRFRKASGGSACRRRLTTLAFARSHGVNRRARLCENAVALAE